eukprot:5346387-Prymnesium_polylepis.1
MGSPNVGMECAKIGGNPKLGRKFSPRHNPACTACAAAEEWAVAMPTSAKCPFDGEQIQIEGVPHRVSTIGSGLVVLKGKTPSGWCGTYRWRIDDKTPEEFADRI